MGEREEVKVKNVEYFTIENYTCLLFIFLFVGNDEGAQGKISPGFSYNNARAKDSALRAPHTGTGFLNSHVLIYQLKSPGFVCFFFLISFLFVAATSQTHRVDTSGLHSPSGGSTQNTRTRGENQLDRTGNGRNGATAADPEGPRGFDRGPRRPDVHRTDFRSSRHGHHGLGSRYP